MLIFIFYNKLCLKESKRKMKKYQKFLRIDQLNCRLLQLFIVGGEHFNKICQRFLHLNNCLLPFAKGKNGDNEFLLITEFAIRFIQFAILKMSNFFLFIFETCFFFFCYLIFFALYIYIYEIKMLRTFFHEYSGYESLFENLRSAAAYSKLIKISRIRRINPNFSKFKNCCPIFQVY